MKIRLGIFGTSWFYTFLSVFLAFVMVFTLFPHEVLAQNLRDIQNITQTEQDADNTTPTETPTPAPSDTPEPAVTPGPTPSDNTTNPVDTPEPTPTDSPTPTPSGTPVPTITPTPSPTPEVTPTPTPSPAPVEPKIETLSPAKDILSTSAVIEGSLIELGDNDTIQVFFEYGIDDNYDNSTDVIVMQEIGDFSSTIIDLEPGTLYHYRAAAIWETRHIFGEDATFTTLPAELPHPETQITDLAGKVDENGKFLEDVEAYSKDQLLTISIKKGTTSTTSDEAILDNISISPVYDLQVPPPTGSQYVGMIYDIAPNSVNFEPSVLLSITQDLENIPAGIDLAAIAIVNFDE
jgi:hypothetical protein